MSVVRRGLAHRRQQRELAHRERHIDGIGAVAEAAGHAAAARFDRCRPRARERAEDFLDRANMRRRISGGNGRAPARAWRPVSAAGVRRPAACSRTRNSSKVSAAAQAAARASAFDQAPGFRRGTRECSSARARPPARRARDKARARPACARFPRAPRSTAPTERKCGRSRAGARFIGRLGDMHAIAGGRQHGDAPPRGSRARNSG